MKLRLVKLLFFLLIFQFDLNAQTFKVTVDTLFLNIKDIARPATRVDLTHAVKYNDKYYCFLEENGLKSFWIRTKYFLILSDNGTVLNNIEVPREINNTTYFDFFLRNDTLLAKTYMKHECFYFDFNKMKWTTIKEVDDRVYEDKNFAVEYLEFGEWGQSTWFIDKHTRKEYVSGTCGTIVNLLDGKYYLTNGAEITEIENPLYLKQCDSEYLYQTVKKDENNHEGSNSHTGLNVIYKDTTFYPWMGESPKQTIITSFVANKKLFQLFTDSTSTYVGKIEHKKLIPVQNIGKKYSTFNWQYSYRGNNPDNGSRFLKFRENNNTFGFIEIQNSNIAIHYLKHNLDSLNYLGSDGFIKLLELLKTNPSNILFEQVANIEKKLRGTDMKIDRTGIAHNGFYPKEYNSGDYKTKRFVKVIDKNITQETEYLYSTSDNCVKSIFIEWSLTMPYNQTNSFDIFKNKPESSGRFSNKQNEIIRIITKQFGLDPVKKNRGNGYFELSWTSNSGIAIVLHGSDFFGGKKEIRMIINLKK